MNKVVVTGANGFMGRALSIFLADKGIDVYALSLHAENIPAHEKITPISINKYDSDNLIRVLDEIRPDVAYHLAWQGMSYEFKNDIEVQKLNIPIYTDFIKAAAGRCSRLVIPGSTAEYAYSGRTIDGKGDPAPGDAYAKVKSDLQLICRELAKNLDIPLCWILIGSVYGPGRVDNNIITYSIRAFLHNEDTAFTGLEQQWDYIYIDDLLNAMYLVGKYGKDDTVYPVGSGDVKPLAEYIRIIRNLVNQNAELGIGKLPYKNGKCPDNNIPDISLLCRDTGYKSQVTFEEGIYRTVEFIKSLE